MNTKIFKICKRHGELTEENVRKEKTRIGNVTYKCHFCKMEKDRRYKERNRAVLAEKNKIYKKNNRNVVNSWNKQDKEKDPEKYKEWAKKGRERLGPLRNIKEITRVRGISLEEYYEIEGKQDGKCAICGLEETRKSRNGGIARLCLDHNHATGQVRSLLCHACNQVVGHSKESIEILKSAIQYLESHEH